MRSKVSLKIAMLSAFAALIPVCLICVVIIWQKNKLQTHLKQEIDGLLQENMTQIVKDVYNMCHAMNGIIQKEVNHNLNVLKLLYQQKGEIWFSPNKVKWNAVNQFTKESKVIELPQMYIGNEWLGQNKSMTIPTPLVDEMKNYVGDVTATIFQRINHEGDMLRVATNVQNVDGTRAISTYIPATNPDGKQNPVLANVLKGEIYRGRAFVVNSWYITAYEPIKNIHGEIIGMLYVGVKQKKVEENLKEAILNIKVGKTGYFWALGAKEEERARYIISKDGKRIGEDLWDAKDADGHFYIQSIINKALKLSNCEIAHESFILANMNDKNINSELSFFTYFEPWDWVIGTAVSEVDYKDAKQKVEQSLNDLLLMTIIVGAALLMVALIMAFWMGNKFGNPILRMSEVAKHISGGNLRNKIEIQRNDEIGQLAVALKDMQKNLSTMINNISSTAKVLVNSAKQLNSISAGLISSSQIKTEQATQVANSSEEMSQNISLIASTAEEMNMNISMVATGAQEMSNNMSLISESVNAISHSMDQISVNSRNSSNIANDAMKMANIANNSMGTLGNSANEIGAVTEIIKRIAEKTNLLSLNATIEAASAGEAGKGFAVVANEIKELANQSAEAAEIISLKVESVQQSADEAVKVINEVAGFIQKINHAEEIISQYVSSEKIAIDEISANIGEANQGIKNIAKSVQELTVGSSELSKNSAEAALGANHIAKSILAVSLLVVQTHQKATNVNTSADEISKIAEKLKNLSDKFII